VVIIGDWQNTVWTVNVYLIDDCKKALSKLDKHQKLILAFGVPCIIVTCASLQYTSLSGYFVGFITLVLSLWLFFVASACRAETQYQVNTMSNLLSAMIEGDYSMRSRLQDNQVLNDVSRLLNELAETLLAHKLAAKESRLLLERMVEQMDAMIIATNDAGHIVIANKSAQQFFKLNNISLHATHLPSHPIGQMVVECNGEIVSLESDGLTGQFLLLKETFLSGGKTHQLYVIRDANRLLMQKERKAWQGLVRVLSHEMNNSLTPIIAISQQVQKKLAEPEREPKKDLASIQTGIGIIQERASSLSTFISAYGELTHLPDPQKSLYNLKQLVEATLVLYSGFNNTINIADNLQLHIDKKQIEQVFVNVIKNAQEAMADSDIKHLTISASKEANRLKLHFIDTGSGIGNADNLFVPFYSTKSKGSGIGLALCRQIMFNHDGTINLFNRQDTDDSKAGTCVEITFNGQIS